MFFHPELLIGIIPVLRVSQGNSEVQTDYSQPAASVSGCVCGTAAPLRISPPCPPSQGGELFGPINKTDCDDNGYNGDARGGCREVYRSVVKSDEERVVLAAVYVPMQLDTDDEAMTVAEVQKAAYQFLSSGRVNQIDVQHNGTPCGASVVESFIARVGDPDFPVPGTWVMAVKVHKPELWQRIKAGELNGFSLAGNVIPFPSTVRYRLPVAGAGRVESNSSVQNDIPDHDHEAVLSFTDSGCIVPTVTSEELGHTHTVAHGTVTGNVLGHAHRFVLQE